MSKSMADAVSQDDLDRSKYATPINQVKLPYNYVGECGKTYELLGWHDSTRLKIRWYGPHAPSILLNSTDSLNLLRNLGLEPESIPNQPRRKQIKEISRKEWEMFLRFKEVFKQLRETAHENLSEWKDHIRFLQEECRDYNEDYEDLATAVRTMPKLLSYVLRGIEGDDEDDDDGMNDSRWGRNITGPIPRQVVKVEIVDISTGDL